MSDLIEAMAKALAVKAAELDEEAPETCGRLQFILNRSDIFATAALAKLRETHHLVPKDQEPVGYWYDGPMMVVSHFWKNRMQKESIRAETETPLYALEKRHD